MTQLDELAAELDRATGDNLVSLVLYGSAARGNYDPKRSDVNLLLIVRDAGPEALQPLGGLVGRWTKKAGQPPPLIFSEAEWLASTDVFAMEIEDMRQAHRVLRGADPFAGLETSPADLRTELEREARGKLLQLRSEFAATEADGRALGDLLETSAGTFFVLFRALLRLKGTVPARKADELVAQTATLVGFGQDAFQWPLARLAGHSARRLEAHDKAGAQYLSAIARFVTFMDEMD